MNYDIYEIIDQGWNCDATKSPILLPIKSIIIDYNINHIVAESVSNYQKIVIICDDYTYAIAEKVKMLCKDATIYLIKGRAVAEISLINSLIDLVKDSDLIIAVGSGSINDICKYLSFVTNIKYFCYATAPSMNGYCSPTASIINQENIKQSYLCEIPEIIFMDLQIIKNSPKRLIRAGIADILCRSTIDTDLYISHVIFGNDYNEFLMKGLLYHEKKLLSIIDKLFDYDDNALKLLCEAIIFSGIAMCVAKDSSPASQSEHMLVHYYNSLKNTKSDLLHGEEIAVATLIMKNLQNKIIMESNFSIKKIIEDKNQGEIYLKKITSYKKIEKNADQLNKAWKKLQDHILSFSLGYNELKNLYEKLSLPTKYDDLNWNQELLVSSIQEAVFSRERYTILDLAYLGSYLNKPIENLFK